MGARVGLLNEDRPRQHHYLFAHRTLLAIARRFAGGFPELVKSGRMDAALVKAWQDAGSKLAAGDVLPHEGLHASLHDLGGKTVVLVALPQPAHAAEAYFVGIVVVGDQFSDYFVLEHGWGLRDEPRTVFCKWDDQGHVNMGDGPPAEAGAFLSAVETQLSS